MWGRTAPGETSWGDTRIFLAELVFFSKFSHQKKFSLGVTWGGMETMAKKIFTLQR